MKIFIKTKKIISVITALCLLVSFVIGPTTANAMTNEEATAKYKQIFKDFMLPYNYGQITDSHYAGTDRVIVNIQDLHCHPKVQKNISNIIEIFDKSFGVKNVYLEGVYGQLSTKWITDRLDNAKKSEILEKMLETGRLTGAEYYSIMSGKTEIITGLEEKIPYLENLKRFGEIIENQEKINLILKAIDESLFKLKKQYYTKRQYKLEELSKNYREGTISPQKYYALLLKHTDKLGIDLSKYENTFTYMTLLEMQKNLDYSKITTELQNLILLLRENLANSAYQMLVDNTENFSKIDKLYGYIVRISRELGLDLTVNFPNLDNYFSYIEFSQKINPLKLIIEEKKLTEEINTKFSETKAQREVVFLTNFEKYLKDYVSSKITSDDYEYYKENIDTFRLLWNKYVDNKVLDLLDEYIVEADKFYKINTDRNIYFTDNMFTKESVLGKIENEIESKDDVNKIIDNMKAVKEVDIVITGGFHSQTVTEILKNHGVSYIVITPNVTDGVKLAEDTYYEIAKEQSKISFQTLATLPFSAYSEDIRVKAAVMAFGKSIAKELFPNRAEEIDIMDVKKLTNEEKAIAGQMAELRRAIEENKFLDSDDDNFIEFLEKVNGGKVNRELKQYVDLDDLKDVLTTGQVGYIKNVLKEAEKDMNSKGFSKRMRSSKRKIRRVFLKATDKFRSQENYLRKQELIRKINAVNLSFFDSKLLKDIREESRDVFNKIQRDFEGKKIESLSLEELEEYWTLKKKLLTIFEPKDEEGVKSVLEEVFSEIEVFVSFIGNSAAKGDYGKIALSFAASFANQLGQKLGRNRLGIISSMTTDKDSIDAISTVVAQMYDALMVYVTAIDYLKYVDPKKYPGSADYKKIQELVGKIDKEALLKNGTNLEDFLTAFKFVAENGDIYSQSVAKANNTTSSNVAVIIGGGNVAIKKDLKNARTAGNEVFLINSRTLARQSQAPAIDHKNLLNLNSEYAVGNAVQFILNIIELLNKNAISISENGDIVINLPELEFTDEEKDMFSQLEEKKKQLAELRGKNGDKTTKEIIDLENEIDKIADSLGQQKIFYYLLKEKILADKEKHADLIELTKYLLTEFSELRKKLEEEQGRSFITEEDLHKSQIHIFDMEDEHVEDANEENVYKSAAEKVASKIISFLEEQSFFKKALTHSDITPEKEPVTSAKIKRAFDLQYAVRNGYVVKVEEEEEIEAVRGTTTRKVYKLKDSDSSKQYTKFVLSKGVDGITDRFRTDVDDYIIDPMFVIYEDGSIGFMPKQDFEYIYGDAKKGNFEEISENTENEFEVCSLEPRTIVQTDKGRVTIHPNEIVIKKGNSIHVMAVSDFEKIFSRGEKLSDKKAETTEEQQKKTGIRNIFKKALMVLIISLSLIGVSSSAIAMEQTSLPAQETAIVSVQEEPSVQKEQPIIYSTPNIEQILASDEMLEQLYSSFGDNNSMFAPKDKDYLRYSLERSKDVSAFFQNDMGRVLSTLKSVEGYDYVPEIIFMKTDSKDPNLLGSACAHSVEINGERKDFVIIPVNYNDDDTFILEHQIFSTLVHEITHLVNKDKVDADAGLMSKLQDEYEATRNGYIALTFGVANFSNFEDETEEVGPFKEYLRQMFDKFSQDSEYDITFEEVYENYARKWMRAYGLKRITQNQGTVVEPFTKNGENVSFNDLYYRDVVEGVKSEDGKHDIVMIEIINTKSNERGIYAVIDDGGYENGPIAGEVNMQEDIVVESKYEKDTQDETQQQVGQQEIVETQESVVEQKEEVPQQQPVEQEMPTQQAVKASRNKLPLLAFFGLISAGIIGFVSKIISSKKSKATFKDTNDIATFLINKDGKIYSLTAKVAYLTDEDEKRGDYIDIGIKGRKLVLYLSSEGRDAYSLAEEKFKTETKAKTIKDIEKYFPGLKISVFGHSITVRSNDTGTNVDVVGHKKNSDIVSSLKKRDLPISEEDKKALEELKKEFGEPQTIYLDRTPEENIPIAESAFNKNGLLVVYPFSNFYEADSIKDRFALYLQLKRNLNMLLRDQFPITSGVDYFLGVTIIYEFIKNAIIHGNSADIFRPIYIKYDEDGFTVYNVYTDPEENPISDEESKDLEKRVSLSAAADLSGAHAGLNIIQEYEKKGRVSVTQNGPTKISGKDFYAAGVKFPTATEQQKQTTSQVDQIQQQEPTTTQQTETKPEAAPQVEQTAQQQEQTEIELISLAMIKSKRGEQIVEKLNDFIRANQSSIKADVSVVEYMVNEFVDKSGKDEYIIEVIEDYLLGKMSVADSRTLIKKSMDELKKEAQQLQDDRLKEYILKQLDNFQIVYAKNLLTIAKANPNIIKVENIKDYTKKFLSDSAISDLIDEDSSLAIRIFNIVAEVDSFLDREKISVNNETLDILKRILLHYFKEESIFSNDGNMIKALKDFFNVKYKGMYSYLESRDKSEEERLFESVKRSGIDTLYDGDFFSYAAKNGATVSTIEGFSRGVNERESQNVFGKLKDIILSLISKRYKAFKNLNGFSLGLSGRNIITVISEETKLMPWEDYYSFYDGIYKSPSSINNIEDHMKHLVADSRLTGKKIRIFVQSEIFGINKEEAAEKSAQFFEANPSLQRYKREEETPYGFGITTEEIIWLKHHPESLKYVEFVFDTYDYFDEITKETTSIDDLAKFYRENLLTEMNLDEQQQQEPTTAIEFIAGESKYLYSDNKVYEMMNNNELVEIQNVEIFDANDKKYMNLNNQLYEIKKGEIVLVSEEQIDTLKADKKYGEWFKLLVDRIIPVGLSLSLVSQIFDTNKAMKMKGKNIIVDYNTELNEELIEAAKSAGINIVKLRIIEEAEAIRRGGSLINEQAKIRMAFDSSSNELLVYSKQGINLDKEKIKELIAAAYSEGRKDLKFTSEQVIAFAETGEVGINLGVKQSLINIQNRIANAAIDGIQRAEVEASLDLSGMGDFGSLENKCKGMSPTTIILSASQLDSQHITEINELRRKGFRFILRGQNINEIRDAFENSDFKLDGAILEKATKTDLEILEDLAAGNTEGTLHIETQMYVDMATAKGLDANRIYTDNGIIPIVTAGQVGTMTGKYAIGYGETKNSDLGKMLSSGKVVNILCSEKDGEQLKDLRDELASIFKNMFGTMNELLKPKSPEQRISEETAAVSDYNFDETLGNMETMKDIIVDDLSKDGIIKEILTTSDTTKLEKMMKDLQALIKEAKGRDNLSEEKAKLYDMYQQLPSVIQMRLQTQMDKGNYFEAIGTIRGFVNQVVDRALLDQWTDKNLTSEEQRKKYNELKNEYLGKAYKDYRQYTRIIIIQLLMSNEELKLDSLVKLRPDTNQSVSELFEEIKTNLNKSVIKSIIENKTAIKEITSGDKGNTITNLGNILALLEGSLIKASATEKLEIPLTAVRKILAAA